MALFLLSLLKFSPLPSLCLATIFIPGPLCLQRVLTTQSVDTKTPLTKVVLRHLTHSGSFRHLQIRLPSLQHSWSQSASSGRIAHLTCTNIYMFANQIRLLRLPPFSLNETLAWFQRTKTHFQLKGMSMAGNKADQVVDILPEEVFHHMVPWSDSRPDELDGDVLHVELLKEFSSSPSGRTR